MQCDERVYSMKRATSAVRGECIWLNRNISGNICSIWKVTSAVGGEKVCSTRIVESAV